MKTVLILKDCRYAQNKPSLPALSFKAEELVEVADYMADSMVTNEDAWVDDGTQDIEPESKESTDDEPSAVEPETKEKPRKPAKASAKKKG